MTSPARLAFAALAGLVILLPAPTASGDPGGSGNGLGGEPGISPGLTPGAAALLLCPGVGTAVNVLGAGGGYCDFNFTIEGHIHCEWGGFIPIAQMWQCWRVFPGQPDHPGRPDPDVIPDGWGVPWAITGPTPQDQWPPPGLTPAPPPPPAEPPTP
jgi:hypothetical protein